MSSQVHVQNDAQKGLAFSLAGAVLSSTSTVMAKYSLRGFNPETSALLLTSAAAAYTLIITVATGDRRQMTRPAGARNSMVLIGLLNAFATILYLAGLDRLASSFAAFLWQLLPVLVVVLSRVFLDERLLLEETIAAAIMLFGACLSVVGRWQIVGAGMILTMLSMASVAVQMLVVKTLVTEMHPSVIVGGRYAISTAVIAIWALVTGRADFGAEASHWMVALLGTFLGPCLGVLLRVQSYRYWDLSRASIVLTAGPVFTLAAAYVMLGEVPAQKELLGGGFILGGAIWFAWTHYAHGARQIE